MPLLVIRTNNGAVSTPGTLSGKSSLVGLKVRFPVTAFPVRGINCGRLDSLVPIASEALSAPGACG
jgi:hypothetical protein